MLKRLWSFLGSSLPSAEKTANPGLAGTQKKKKLAPHWNLNVEEADGLLRENSQVMVLDVRTPEEFAAGHLKGARNVDFFNPQFQEKISAFDKSRPYLLHCASGHRSARAQAILAKLNFQAVYHLDGGLKAWVKAGKTLVD
jgi:rhodanese-related sulfurtransferase